MEELINNERERADTSGIWSKRLWLTRGLDSEVRRQPLSHKSPMFSLFGGNSSNSKIRESTSLVNQYKYIFRNTVSTNTLQRSISRDLEGNVAVVMSSFVRKRWFLPSSHHHLSPFFKVLILLQKVLILRYSAVDRFVIVCQFIL